MHSVSEVPYPETGASPVFAFHAVRMPFGIASPADTNRRMVDPLNAGATFAWSILL